MAKQMISKSTNIKVVGNLDKTEDGRYIVTVETKENIREYELDRILDDMIGTEISLSSVEEII